MSEFTFQEKHGEDIYETFEWDNTWIEHATDRETKRVLYIGDSISCPTRRKATIETGDKIYFDGFGSSKGLDNPVFKEALSVFTSQIPHVDAVVFNNGLHGFHLDDRTDYAKFYEEFVCFLMEKYKVPVAVVLTTFVKKETISRVHARNEVALKIAEKYSLPVIDFYTLSEQNSHLIAADNVHFTDEGYSILARALVKAATELL